MTIEAKLTEIEHNLLLMPKGAWTEYEQDIPALVQALRRAMEFMSAENIADADIEKILCGEK